MASGGAVVRVLKDVVLDLLLFPLFWYTTGLSRTLTWAGNSITGALRTLSLSVWIKNLFVPMYGQRDWQSRLISVFMRSVQIVFRLFGLAIWMLAVLLLVALYVLLPMGLVGFLLYHLLGSLS